SGVARVEHPVKVDTCGRRRCFCMRQEYVAQVIGGERAQRTRAVLNTPRPYIAGVWLNAIRDHVLTQIIVAQTVCHIMLDDALDNQPAKISERQAAIEPVTSL